MNKERGLGVILQYVQMALSIIISLIYTPIMLKILGKTEYGIYNLASSIIAYLSLLSLGFGGSYIRFYSIYKKNNDNESLKKMNGLYLFVFSIMGIVSLLAGLLLANNIQIFFNNTYSDHDLYVAKVLMIFLAVNMAISFPASVFVSYISSQEKFIFQKIVNMGKTIISPTVNIIFLYLGYGSIGMVISTTLISFLIDIINVAYCIKKLKMCISFKKMNFSLLKRIFVFSAFLALSQVIDQINWQTDKVILGKMINGAAVAIYTVGANLNGMYISFSTAISSVFSPKVNMIVQKGEDDMDLQLTNLMIKVGRIQWFILMLALLGFIFFGKFFIYNWAGADYGTSYYVTLLLIAPVTIPLIQNIGLEIQIAKNKHQFRSIAYAIMAILNVGVSILFCYLWGTIGVAIGTTISLLIANALIMNIYYQKKLGINIIGFWKSIGSTLPGMIIPVLCGVCLILFYNFNSLFDFVLLALTYSIIYCISIYFLGMNNEERNIIKGLYNKVLRR